MPPSERVEKDPEISSNSQYEWNGDIDPFSDPEEKRVIFAALDSFRQYRRRTHYNTTHRRRQNLYALPNWQWNLLASPPVSILSTLNAVDDAIDANADIAEAILSVALKSFNLPENPSKDSPLYWHDTATAEDHGKAHSTIRQFYRDWSAEGVAGEIESIGQTVLSDLKRHLADPLDSTSQHRPRPSVLVPGAGLGRILLTLILHGYDAQGNEISYHQLFASNWILNHVAAGRQYPLYPFTTTFTNLPHRHSQLHRVMIPDLHPGQTLSRSSDSGSMSMVAGDFVDVYSPSSFCGPKFDALLTLFFLDTTPNLLTYLRTANHLLRLGGIWINIGPLLWHFDNNDHHHHHHHHHQTNHNSDYQGSFEPTADEIIHLLTQFGFEVLTHDDRDGVGYIQNPTSMLQNLYRCHHWVVRKIGER